MTPILILLALVIVAITSTVVTVIRDGYRRAPARRPLREYERPEPYRAWTGRV